MLIVNVFNIGKIRLRNFSPLDPIDTQASATVEDYKHLKAWYKRASNDSLADALWKTLIMENPMRAAIPATVLEILWGFSPPSKTDSFWAEQPLDIISPDDREDVFVNPDRCQESNYL